MKDFAHRRLRFRAPLLLLGAAFALMLDARPASASYPGYGDTGWTHDNKRDCCEDAGWLAQEDSALRCQDAGGRPKVRSGSIRAQCDWDAQGGGRDRVYRCTARTSVDCR